MKPIAVVATHPIQYQTPLYAHLTAQGLPIHVFFLSTQGLKAGFDVEFGKSVAWDIPLIEGYPHEFLPSVQIGKAAQKLFVLVNPAILTRIQAGRFSAVLIHGHRNLSMLMAAGRAKLGRIPVLYRSDSIDLVPGAIKRSVLGRGFRSVVSACLSVGSLNDSFYDSLGMPPQRRFLVPHVVDNGRFQRVAATVSKQEARRELGLHPNGRVVLYAGKLVPWKQPDMLVRAFAGVAPPDSQLVFAGDGEMRAELERWSRSYLPGRVTFLGFMNQSRIPIAYRGADLLVLPSSRERWGLVVNEAMNFGVPVLVSDRVGCGPDLVIPGITGAIFRAGDAASLKESLAALLDDPDRLRAMGRHAFDRIQRWGLPEAEAGIRRALDSLGIAV